MLVTKNFSKGLSSGLTQLPANFESILLARMEKKVKVVGFFWSGKVFNYKKNLKKRRARCVPISQVFSRKHNLRKKWKWSSPLQSPFSPTKYMNETIYKKYSSFSLLFLFQRFFIILFFPLNQNVESETCQIGNWLVYTLGKVQLTRGCL